MCTVHTILYCCVQYTQMEADSRAFFQELYSFLCFFSFSNTDSSNQDHILFVVFVTLGFFFLFLFRNSSAPQFAAAQWGGGVLPELLKSLPS